jgi:hypothetical protein
MISGAPVSPALKGVKRESRDLPQTGRKSGAVPAAVSP